MNLIARRMEFQTNTTITETHVQVNLRWDVGYVKTVPGILKCLVLVRNIFSLLHNNITYLMFVVGDQPDRICLYYVLLTLLQRTASGGVVRVCGHDGLLGQPCHPLHVSLPRHGEVPRDSLADD